MRTWIQHFQKPSYMNYRLRMQPSANKWEIHLRFFFSFSTSVADPGCLSRIPDPDFYPSQIRSKNSNERQGWKKNLCLFLGAINFTKFNYFIFKMLQKKIWANLQRIIELFTQKIVTKLSKSWVWDPGSEIRKNLFRIPGPIGTGSRIRNTVFNHFCYLES